LAGGLENVNGKARAVGSECEGTQQNQTLAFLVFFFRYAEACGLTRTLSGGRKQFHLSKPQTNMAKPYQHHDEYHDIGKAMPKPKRPTHYTYRGRGLTFSAPRTEVLTERNARVEAKKNASYTEKPKIHVSMYAAVAAVLGFTRRFGRGQ
jgi:hypothetical protein